MSANFDANESADYFHVNNTRYDDGEESFTDLQSCDLDNDTDSQSSHSSDVEDDNDHKRQGANHSSLLNKKKRSDEDEDLTKSKGSIAAVTRSKSSNDIVDLIHEDFYKSVFMPISKEFSGHIRCRITRKKYDMAHAFHLQIERENDREPFHLLTAEKPLNVAGSTQYIISVVPKLSNDSYSVELRSANITGTSYSLYDLSGNERQQLAVILYESNFLGLKGPRKIEVLLPIFNNEMQSVFEEDDLADYNSKLNITGCDSKITNDGFVHLQNKPPVWNPSAGSYSLSFDGDNRVIQPSIKNFQMMIKNEKHEQEVVMQFGRMSDNEFSCDFCHPLSIMQAFGIALSAFESRLFRD